MNGILDWIQRNSTTLINWFISLLTIAAPIFVVKTNANRIVKRENSFEEFIVTQVKLIFFYTALMYILGAIGTMFSIPNSREWLNRKTYIVLCIIIALFLTVIALVGGILRVFKTTKTEVNEKHGLRLFIILYTPVVLHAALYFAVTIWGTAVNRMVSVLIAAEYFFVIFYAVRTFGVFDSFEYSCLNIHLSDGTTSFKVSPKDVWETDKKIKFRDDLNRIFTVYKKDIQSIEYSNMTDDRKPKTKNNHHTVLVILLFAWCLFIVGYANQVLLYFAIDPIAIAEKQIVLKPGEHYQLKAVSLIEYSGNLHYEVKEIEQPVITVSQNGIIAVKDELPENEMISEEVIISDDKGNKISVLVKMQE